MEQASEQWKREAVRLHERYLVEIVEACGLCPWAEPARRLGRTRISVVLDGGPGAVEPSAATIETWAADGGVEVGFLVYPRLALGRSEFDRFVASVREVDARQGPSSEARFALAAFHPDAAPDLADAERLIPFLRRTPDPCIQVVRMAALRRVRSRTPQGTQFVDLARLDTELSREVAPPLREQIARANLETVRGMGVTELAARIEDIRRDRDRSYAALNDLAHVA